MFANKKTKALQNIPSNTGGWWPIVREAFGGAWQRNIEYKRETVLAYHAIFSCISLIASDISKLRIKMVKQQGDIWVDIPFGDYKVLEKPNKWQNRIQFFESWLNSKLIRGNAYILKQRGNDGKVIALYVLCPDLVQVQVSTSGEVFYQLSQDILSDLESSIIVPASEIIHDRYNTFFHPLCGLSPLFASGLAGYQGQKMQENAAHFFANNSQPGGILSAPGAISDVVATRLKEAWQQSYAGVNSGKVAVLGDDLKYTPLSFSAVESQMVEQMKLTAQIVCSTFHVPNYKVIGDAPSYNNIEAMEQQYYSQCLQVLIEAIELCLDEGLDVKEGEGTEFELDGLLRMDTNTQVKTLKDAVGGSLMSPNEARTRLNLKPATGGDSPLSQQQNYSLEALAKRDESPDPFKTSSSTAPAALPAPKDDADDLKLFADIFIKSMAHA